MLQDQDLTIQSLYTKTSNEQSIGQGKSLDKLFSHIFIISIKLCFSELNKFLAHTKI